MQKNCINTTNFSNQPCQGQNLIFILFDKIKIKAEFKLFRHSEKWLEFCLDVTLCYKNFFHFKNTLRGSYVGSVNVVGIFQAKPISGAQAQEREITWHAISCTQFSGAREVGKDFTAK